MAENINDLLSHLEKLEAEISFQGSSIDTLDQLVQKQQQDIHTLQQHVALLVKHLSIQGDQEGKPQVFDPVAEKPPHY